MKIMALTLRIWFFRPQYVLSPTVLICYRSNNLKNSVQYIYPVRILANVVLGEKANQLATDRFKIDVNLISHVI